MTDLKNILNNKSNYLKECVLTDNGVLIKEDSIKKRNRYVKLILYDKYNENNSIEVLLQIIKKKSTGVEFKDINLEPSAITFITLMRINEGNYIQELILNQYKKIYKAFNLGDIKKDSSSSSLSSSSKLTSSDINLIKEFKISLSFYTLYHYLLKPDTNLKCLISKLYNMYLLNDTKCISQIFQSLLEEHYKLKIENINIIKETKSKLTEFDKHYSIQKFYVGVITNTLIDILSGIRSACTYVGAKRLKSLSKCATFVRVNNTHNTIFGEE